MKKLLAIVAIGEAATGLVLLLDPFIVVRLLFGAEIAGVGVAMSRIAGISLIALGLACWPGPALVGMLTYSVLATVYLFYLAVGSEWVGKLLWPAIAAHVILTVLLGRTWFNELKSAETKR